MIYVLTIGDYDDTDVEAVFEGPDEPGIKALLEEFSKLSGMPDYAPLGKFDWKETEDWKDDWRKRRDALWDEEKRIVREKFGCEAGYRDAAVKWLVTEKGFKPLDFDEFSIETR